MDRLRGYPRNDAAALRKGGRLDWRFVTWWTATGGGFAAWLVYIATLPAAVDAHAYFLGQYGEVGVRGAYLYSPAFSQVIEPLRWLGWNGFRTAWRVAELAVLAAFTGPIVGPAMFVQPVAVEIEHANIHLLLAGAIVAGFRYPALWAFVLLTKVTPGVGLLWFVVRREWRNLGIALAATAAVVAVSFVAAPGAWFDWLALLADGGTVEGQLITAPLWLRLPAAAALVAWGARRDYRWTVLVAAFLALPVVWITAPLMLLGLVNARSRAGTPTRRS